LSRNAGTDQLLVSSEAARFLGSSKQTLELYLPVIPSVTELLWEPLSCLGASGEAEVSLKSLYLAWSPSLLFLMVFFSFLSFFKWLHHLFLEESNTSFPRSRSLFILPWSSANPCS